MTSSGCFSIVSAARAIAAAVFRPIGSTTTRTPGVCSRTICS